MMKKIYYLLLLTLCIGACGEEDLAPSFKDVDRLPTQLDLSQPLVKKYKESYNINILYRFDDTLDFKFAMFDKAGMQNWGKLEIDHVSDTTVHYGLKTLDELVLQYFKDTIPDFQGKQIVSDFKNRYFPRTILVAQKLSGLYTSLGQFLGELDNTETSSYYSALWNGYEQMFAFDSLTLEVGKTAVTNKTKARNSALYCFLSHLISAKSLNTAFPDEFYEPVKAFYGKSISSEGELDKAPVGTGRDSVYYKASWYIGKGFALTRRSPNVAGNSTNYDRRVEKTKNFPDRARDVRDFLHVIICESEANVKKYYAEAVSPVFAARMRMMIEQLYAWGIDVFAINPAMEEFYKDK